MATISPTDAVADIFGVKLSGVPAKVAWAGCMWDSSPDGATGWSVGPLGQGRGHPQPRRTGDPRGLGDTGALAQLARADEPGQLRRPRE